MSSHSGRDTACKAWPRRVSWAQLAQPGNRPVTCAEKKFKAMAVEIKPEVKGIARKRTWSESDGTGDRQGVWGLSGAAGEALALAGTIMLLVCCPFVALLTYEVRSLLVFVSDPNWVL